VVQEGTPFFKWHTWIEQTLNKEFMDMIFQEKKGKGSKKKGKEEEKESD